ncbi:cysteine proteinase [Rhizoclosmatium globosum]|uniref:Cysteine proteinase n=1 Tax=Rhizoclosmatium globosum TaxID=329046 RepID=A0A1Y2BSD4_9FUNG|nr:cysteine proteinase [Rhizoclosmatium globosum]|eukprot:ORY37660.1 cysteine proteinase [Rhizoclosmatium globosum]
MNLLPSSFEALTSPQLSLYLSRLGLDPSIPLSPTKETLQTLLTAHATTIPWENTSLYLSHKPHPLSIPEILETLVTERRGSYCFPNNILLSSALKSIGFQAYTGVARLMHWNDAEKGYDADAPVHMIVFVVVDGAVFLVDMDFNRVSVPLRVSHGERVVCAAGEIFEVREVGEGGNGEGFVLWYGREGSEVKPFYWFTVKECWKKDYEVMNFYVGNERKHDLHNVFLISRDVVGGGRVKVVQKKLYKSGEKGGVEMETLEEWVLMLMREFGVHLNEIEIESAKQRLFS